MNPLETVGINGLDIFQILETVLRLPLASQPWWVFALAALVPICVMITVREFFCWFWKINKLVSRLERIEKSLNSLRLGTVATPSPRPTSQRVSGNNPGVATGKPAVTSELAPEKKQATPPLDKK